MTFLSWISFLFYQIYVLLILVCVGRYYVRVLSFLNQPGTFPYGFAFSYGFFYLTIMKFMGLLFCRGFKGSSVIGLVGFLLEFGYLGKNDVKEITKHKEFSILHSAKHCC